jgi:hypothetical protein
MCSVDATDARSPEGSIRVDSITGCSLECLHALLPLRFSQRLLAVCGYGARTVGPSVSQRRAVVMLEAVPFVFLACLMCQDQQAADWLAGTSVHQCRTRWVTMQKLRTIHSTTYRLYRL